MQRSLLTTAESQEHLTYGIESFVAHLDGADLDAPVPTCPGWTVRDLVAHLAAVHRWVVRILEAANPGRAEPDEAETAPPPGSPVADWYGHSARAMLEALRTVDPAQPVWTLAAPFETAAFWSRRQSHEVAVHRIDLLTACGQEASYDERLALDGIDEVVGMFFPRQVRLGRIAPLPVALGIAPDGYERRWVLGGDGTADSRRPVDSPGTVTTPATAAIPAATVSGPAAALVLLLWGRTSLDDPRLRVHGDLAAARAVLATAIVP